VQASHAIVPTETAAREGLTAANAQAAAKPQSAMPQQQAESRKFNCVFLPSDQKNRKPSTFILKKGCRPTNTISISY